MAFGFGIGDVILACQGVIAVYTRCKNAPLEIIDVTDNVKRMESTLTLLGKVVVNEKTFVQKHGEDMLFPSNLEITMGLTCHRVSMITDDIPPLKHDVRKIKRLIKRWNSIPHTQTPLLARGKFIAWDLATVKDLRSNLEEFQNRLIYVLQLVNFSEHEAQSAQAKVEKKQRMLERAIEKNARKLRDAKEDLHRIETRAAQERIFHMLEKIDKKEPDSVSRIARSGNAVSVAALEKTLVDSGIPAKEVNTHLDYFMAVLGRDPATQPTPNAPQINVQGVSDNPSPGNGGLNRHRSDAGLKTKGISPAPKPNGSRGLSSSNSPVLGPSLGNVPRPTSLGVTNMSPYAPTQLPVRIAPNRNSEGKRILCIDGSNGGKASSLAYDFVRTN
jgi:hypothetical protein